MRTVVILGTLLLVGCGYLQNYESLSYSRDWRPSLSVHGAPSGSTLYVDDREMGEANQFDGNPTVLRLIPGTYRIKVIQGTTVFFEQKIGLGSAYKKIFVR